MQPPVLTKFGFRIRTRMGLVVENLSIAGRDASEAERKLRQIYRDCEILERQCRAAKSGWPRAAAVPAAVLPIAAASPALIEAPAAPA
jgi:hypothetical protein